MRKSARPLELFLEAGLGVMVLLGVMVFWDKSCWVYACAKAHCGWALGACPGCAIIAATAASKS